MKIYIKKICFIISYVLLFFIVPTTNAKENCNLTLTSTFSKKGELVEINVVASECPSIISIAIVPKYSTERLEYVSGEWLISGALISDWSKEKEDGVILFSSETNIQGEIAKLVFRVKDTEAWDEVIVDATVIMKNSIGSISANIIPSIIYLECSHDLEESIYTKEATCLNDGYTYRLCNICKREVIISKIAKLNHVSSDWIVDLEPTREAKGKRHKECLTCGEILEEELLNEILDESKNLHLSIGVVTGIVIGTSFISGFIVFLICIFVFKKKSKRWKA